MKYLLLLVSLCTFGQGIPFGGIRITAAAPSTSVTAIGKTGPTSIQNTCAITTTATVASGHDIVLFMTGSAGSALTCSASDGSADSYSTDLAYNEQSQAYTRSCFVRARKSGSLTSGSTITLTGSSDDNYTCSAYDVAGLTTSPLDQTGTVASYSASPSVTAAGTLAQANELVIGALVAGNTGYTFTATNGYTTLESINAQGKSYGILWKVVASTSAPSVTATLSGAESFSGLLVSYKLP